MAAGGMPISVGKSHRYSLPSEVVRSRQTYMADLMPMQTHSYKPALIGVAKMKNTLL